MPISDLFMPIPPRHRRALELLVDQKKHDPYGAIGTGALRDEDDPFTLEQIINPLWDRGLIEDLTNTDFGRGGQCFTRITPLGEICLGLGYMLRAPGKTTEEAIKQYLTKDSDEQTEVAKSLKLPMKSANPHDPNEEQEAIA
jgi:hypothetical protein